MANQGTEFRMKLLIDKVNKKVLFAEAGKGCVDLFFHILSLPLGTNHQDPFEIAPKNFYTCIGSFRKRCVFSREQVITDVIHKHVTDVAGAACPECNKKMVAQLAFVNPPADVKGKLQRNGGAYVKGEVSYIVMDDLFIKPMSAISCITLIKELGIEDMSSLEEKEVTLDTNLGVAILKASLMSNTALSDVFLLKKPISHE